MSEQRPTDWKGPVALVLAGLALLVALSGRGFPFDGPRNMAFRVEAAPQPVQPAVPAVPPETPKDPGGMYGMTEPMPMMPDDQKLRDELRQMWRDMWGDIKGAPFQQVKPQPPVAPMAPVAPVAPVPPKGEYYFDGGSNVLDGIWGYARGIYDYFQPLLQLALVVLLGIVVFSWLRRRNRPAYPAGSYPGYPPPPQAPPPAQGQGNDTPPTGYPGPGVLD